MTDQPNTTKAINDAFKAFTKSTHRAAAFWGVAMTLLFMLLLCLLIIVGIIGLAYETWPLFLWIAGVVTSFAALVLLTAAGMCLADRRKRRRAGVSSANPDEPRHSPFQPDVFP